MLRRVRSMTLCAAVTAACGDAASPTNPPFVDASQNDGRDAADASRSDARDAGEPTSPSDSATRDAEPGEGSTDEGSTGNPLGCAIAADAGLPEPFSLEAGALPEMTDLPQIVNGGGPVLHHATFVSVSFAGQSYVPQLDDFVGTLGCTDYWRTVGQDYGVGDATATAAVHLTEQAPASTTDVDIGRWLA